jgi:hypothetical protein
MSVLPSGPFSYYKGSELPAAVLDASFGGLYPTTLATLRTLVRWAGTVGASQASGPPNGSCWLLGINTLGDHAPIQYEWVASSTAADDAVSYTAINPTGNTGNGRWIRVGSSSDPVLAPFIPGTPFGGGATLWSYTLPAALTLPANFAGSAASCDTAPTNTATFQVQRYVSATPAWVNIGTVSFAATTGVATFSTQAAVVFQAGDRIRVLGQSGTDATMAGVCFSFQMLR